MKIEYYSVLDEVCKRYGIKKPQNSGGTGSGNDDTLKEYMMNKMCEKIKYIMNPSDMWQFFADCYNMSMIMVYPKGDNINTWIKYIYPLDGYHEEEKEAKILVHMADEEQPVWLHFTDVREKCWVSDIKKHTNIISIE